MAKVTSKLQVTIPKAVADAHGIAPGTELEFESGDDVIRVRVARPRAKRPASEAAFARARLRAFDEATARQAARDAAFAATHPALVGAEERGWSRADLYEGSGVAR